jgi:hypothetical protein
VPGHAARPPAARTHELANPDDDTNAMAARVALWLIAAVVLFC